MFRLGGSASKKTLARTNLTVNTGEPVPDTPTTISSMPLSGGSLAPSMVQRYSSDSSMGTMSTDSISGGLSTQGEYTSLNGLHNSSGQFVDARPVDYARSQTYAGTGTPTGTIPAPLSPSATHGASTSISRQVHAPSMRCDSSVHFYVRATMALSMLQARNKIRPEC